MCQPDSILAVTKRRPGLPAAGAVNCDSTATTLFAEPTPGPNRLSPGPVVAGSNCAGAGWVPSKIATTRRAIPRRRGPARIVVNFRPPVVRQPVTDAIVPHY